jgi:DNA-binding XRE family transcriptional regulator
MVYNHGKGGDFMAIGIKVILFSLVILIPLFALFVYLTVLIIRALRKYIKGSPARKEAKTVRTTLGEKLRENRVRCKMSQEFVAEAVGVSRQAVSKWENGVSDPSTSNLIALAKLFGLSAEELLEGL